MSDIVDLLEQAAVDGTVTCGGCGLEIEPDCETCGNCGWKNPLVAEGFI